MKKGKFTKQKIIALICIIIFSIALIISIINIIIWKIDSDNTDEQISTIQDEIIIEEVPDNEETEIIEQPEAASEWNPYWDYIKMNMIDVDFNELKSTNNQVKGWLQVNGTNINYPFVQTDNNNYYLTHSFDKSYNRAGWVFLDYRNKLDGTDKNIILYAHGRTDKTMFGSLRTILTSGWLNTASNYVVKLSTEYENTLWQVFSVYRIPTTNDYIQTDFANDTEFSTFINMLLNRSSFNFNTTVNANDKIITLSTCYNNTDKVVLHAKLIKREKR